MPEGKIINWNTTTEVQQARILKAEYENSGIWNHIAMQLGHKPNIEEIEVASIDKNVVIPFPENDKIDKNLKFYKEAKWFLDRLVGFNTMSKEEITAVCDMAAIIVRQENFKG